MSHHWNGDPNGETNDPLMQVLVNGGTNKRNPQFCFIIPTHSKILMKQCFGRWIFRWSMNKKLYSWFVKGNNCLKFILGFLVSPKKVSATGGLTNHVNSNSSLVPRDTPRFWKKSRQGSSFLKDFYINVLSKRVIWKRIGTWTQLEKIQKIRLLSWV